MAAVTMACGMEWIHYGGGHIESDTPIVYAELDCQRDGRWHVGIFDYLGNAYAKFVHGSSLIGAMDVAAELVVYWQAQEGRYARYYPEV